MGLPGLYVNPPDELAQKSDPSVVRSNLYLSPDHTYLYAQRGSLLPVTIFDKGVWRVGSGVLELRSGPDIRWNPDLERRFLILRRTSHSDEVSLVGTERAVNRFESLAPRNPEIDLLTIAKQRIKTIGAEQTTKVRDNLMRKAWHPERFGEIPQRALPQPVPQLPSICAARVRHAEGHFDPVALFRHERRNCSRSSDSPGYFKTCIRG
jgi:hypothetical protein